MDTRENRKPAVRALVTVAALMLLAANAFAAGKTEEDAFQRVEGTGNWEHTIDVSELEPGKYNILVRARDRAGNEALGGPFNVFVDPESDQPMVSISYPEAGQPVGERLYIIGTARDDDAVGRVEIQVDDRRPITAEGTDYWSVFVSMEALDDGPHDISVKAFDVNGTEGPAVTIPVQLDTTKPVSITESHESGVLVSRKTTIQGTVEDANGVAELHLIAGDTESALRLRGGKEAAPSFEFQIDPRELEEGPTVWWLRSVDNTGSTGVTPFLFFVDTSPPELELISPLEEEPVDGQLHFVGRVADAVGVASLTYELSSGESGEIELIPGNPYWSLDVDLGPGAGGSLTAQFRVEDVAGNVTEIKPRYKLDPVADQPVVLLSSPAEGEFVDAPAIVGHVVDDDGAAAILYSVDGAEPTRVSTDGGFSVSVAALAPGAHELRISAEDIHGRAGPEIRRRFTVGEPVPAISLTEVVIGEQSSPYRPGFTLAAGERATLSGAVDGSPPPARVSYRVGSLFGRATVEAGGAFSVPLPRGETVAAVPIDVWYATATGRVARMTGFYVQLPAVGEGAPAPSVADVLRPGLYLGTEVAPNALDGIEVPADAQAALSAPIVLPRGKQLQLLAVGGSAASASVDATGAGGTEHLSASASGQYVTLRADSDGYAAALTVTAAVGGTERRSAAFALATELDPPNLTVPSGAIGARLASPPEIPVSVDDPAGVAQVRGRIISHDRAFESTWQTADPQTDAPEGGAEAGADRLLRVSLPPDDGAYSVEIEAADGAGAISRLLVPVFVDRVPPSLAILTPADGEPVNGTVSVIGRLSEPATTASVVAAAGETRSELPTGPTVVFTLVAGAETGTIAFELVDLAGNTATKTVSLNVDDEADRPDLQVQVPEDGGVVRQEFRLSGVLLDDDEPHFIRYRVDGGDEVQVPTSGVFDVSIPMSALEDGDHTLEVTGVDSGGTPSEIVLRTVSISRTEPASVLDSPTINDYLRGEVTFAGRSEDPNGIEAVHVSTDNGASFQLVRGTEEWSYRLDTTQMDDGTHSVLIRATDGAQTEGLLTTTINIDNTSPILELTSPSDGGTVSGEFLIDGRSEDDALSEVRLVAQRLSNGTDEPIVLATFDQSGPFAYVVDASGLPPGWFNLRVEAEDRAGNTNRISLNLRVEPAQAAAAPEIVSPPDGATVFHEFRINVRSAVPSRPLTLLVDGQPLSVIQIDDAGSGSLLVAPGALREGVRELQLRAEPDAAGNQVVSAVTRIEHRALGPWLVVDEPAASAFVRNRPYLSGRAGYALALVEGEDKETQSENRRLLARHQIERVEVSLDNGRSYEPASGTEEWSYRIETTEMPDGQLNLLVRTRFANGESVVVRHSVVVDERPPEVRLLAPQERDRFDESVRIVGVTTDDNVLDDVAVVLREGDKSRYSVPSFVQGLYLDFHAFGATYFDAGAGLTFFDDNVRLQAQVGYLPAYGPGTGPPDPPQRFFGLVIGAKLLANVFSFPFSFIFGPDLEWLSAAIAVGANFSYFTMSGNEIAFTEDGLVLAGMVAQLEFPRIELPDLPVFNTFGFYTEGQLWFISSDVEAGTVFLWAFGLRANVF